MKKNRNAHKPLAWDLSRAPISSFFAFQLLIIILAFLTSCASNVPQPETSRAETPPCENCLSSEPVAFNVSIINSYREINGAQNTTTQPALETAEAIGVLPAFKVIANAPESCDYCHAFSESALEFDFASKEDSVLRTWFPNNERVLLFPGAGTDSIGVSERDSLNFQKAFNLISEIPLSQNKELKQLMKKIGARYKVRYIAFSSFIYANLTSRKTFEWESEWSLWDASKGELIFWNYRNLKAESKNSAPVDRGWSEVAF